MWLTACSSGELDVLYLRADAPDIGFSQYRQTRRLAHNEQVPDFLVEQDHLFLRVQTVRTRWKLYREVDHMNWQPETLQALFVDRPELGPYWPDPTRADFGIPWVVSGSE